MTLKIYLAGPIAGLSYNEAYKWRKQAETKLTNHIVYNPMRTNTHLKHSVSMPTHANTDYAKTIWRQDKTDIENSDLLLVNFLNCKHASVGTCVEIGMAAQLLIPIVVVMEENNIHDHPFITEPASLVVDSLDKAITWINWKPTAVKND